MEGEHMGLLSLWKKRRKARLHQSSSDRRDLGDGAVAVPVAGARTLEPGRGEKQRVGASAAQLARGEKRKYACVLCSKPADEMICGACADRVGADAVEKKRWEETGKP
jgi:hypothetical protein